MRAFHLLISLLLVAGFLAGADPAFTIVVKTDNPGTSGPNQFTLPLFPSATYNCTVDWGDATATQAITTDVSPTHTYAAAGTYTIRIIESVVGGFPRIYFNDGGDSRKLLQVAHWGDVTWNSMASAFHGCNYLTITATDTATAKTRNITDFTFAWTNCNGLTSFPAVNTATGTNFKRAWFGCNGLTSFPLLNTAAGTDFSAAWLGCSGLTSFPLLNTAAGTQFGNAWYGCSGLTSFPLLNTAAGTDFGGAWSGCSGLTSFPLLSTSAAWDFGFAWNFCSGLTSFPPLNTASGISFHRAWEGCTALRQFPTLNLRNMVDGSNCFAGVTLSSASYDNLLIDLATGNVNPNVIFDGGLSRYDDRAASARTTTLVTGRGWTISDAGHARPTITSPTRLDVLMNSAVSYQITVSADNVPTGYGAPSLPGGWSVNASGLITGTAAATQGQTDLIVSASNDGGPTTATVRLYVNAVGAPVITSATAASTAPTLPFSYTITATNTPTSFTVYDPPAGLSLNATTGVIQGTPTTLGTTVVTIVATNANGNGSASLNLTVADPVIAGGGGGSSGGDSGGGGCGAGAAGCLILLLGMGLIRRKRI